MAWLCPSQFLSSRQQLRLLVAFFCFENPNKIVLCFLLSQFLNSSINRIKNPKRKPPPVALKETPPQTSGYKQNLALHVCALVCNLSRTPLKCVYTYALCMLAIVDDIDVLVAGLITQEETGVLLSKHTL